MHQDSDYILYEILHQDSDYILYENPPMELLDILNLGMSSLYFKFLTSVVFETLLFSFVKCNLAQGHFSIF